MRSLLATALPLLLLSACAPTASIRDRGGPGMEVVRLEPYSGPKARIAAARFEDETAKGYGAIGEGMATMFTTTLVNSNRFIVLERDLIEEVIREQDLAAGGWVKAGTGAPTGEIEGAELLLTGAVTAFEPEKLGLGGGLVGLGTLIGTAILHEKDKNIPVAAATYTESHIALDVRVLDTATSRVLASLSVEGKGVDWGGGVIAEVGGGRSRLPLAFGGFQKTATEKAVRAAIDQAVAEIVRQTPTQYFHYTDQAFTSGRMAGFIYLALPGISGENFPSRGFRVADNEAEWASLASSLGAAGESVAGQVDFASHRVVAIFAGTQQEPGRNISVEKVVAYPDRMEITASLLPAPPPPEGSRPEASTAELASLNPVALLKVEKAPGQIRVNWIEAEPQAGHNKRNSGCVTRSRNEA